MTKKKSTKKEKNINEVVEEQDVKQGETTQKEQVEESGEQESEEVKEEEVEKTEEEMLKEENDKLKEEIEILKDKNLRQTAEFDNYRRRTAKEKIELMKNAGEPIFQDILPLVDNFERAIESIEKTDDLNAVKEGVDLIYKEFQKFLSKEGVKEIEAKEKEFDTDFHEAITKIPAPTEELKDKVVDVIKKGYTLNDKVIRYAQVVIGE
jgi:molecular chaperone GrpE